MIPCSTSEIGRGVVAGKPWGVVVLLPVGTANTINAPASVELPAGVTTVIERAPGAALASIVRSTEIWVAVPPGSIFACTPPPLNVTDVAPAKPVPYKDKPFTCDPA